MRHPIPLLSLALLSACSNRCTPQDRPAQDDSRPQTDDTPDDSPQTDDSDSPADDSPVDSPDDSSPDDSDEPTDTGDWVFVDSKGYASCGIRGDGRVQCWGQYWDFSPIESEPATGFSTVSVGYVNTCGMNPGVPGGTSCWGRCVYGECDVPREPWYEVEHVPASALILRDVTGSLHFLGSGSYLEDIIIEVPGESLEQISEAGSVVCGLSFNQDLICWGAPYDVNTEAPSGQFVLLACGEDVCCALDLTGSPVCWGDSRSQGYAVLSPLSGPFAAVTVGVSHACGLEEDGLVSCWGGNDYSFSDDIITPPNVLFRQISAGDWHTCGITMGGAMRCWGVGDEGQLDFPMD